MTYVAHFVGGPYDGRQEIRQGDEPMAYLAVEMIDPLPSTVPPADSPVQPKITRFVYGLTMEHFDHPTRQWHARYALA